LGDSIAHELNRSTGATGGEETVCGAPDSPAQYLREGRVLIA
jgi:hypothetical protein